MRRQRYLGYPLFQGAPRRAPRERVVPSAGRLDGEYRERRHREQCLSNCDMIPHAIPDVGCACGAVWVAAKRCPPSGGAKRCWDLLCSDGHWERWMGRSSE